jgi:FtsZ-binding cell division protein ZapB
LNKQFDSLKKENKEAANEKASLKTKINEMQETNDDLKRQKEESDNRIVTPEEYLEKISQDKDL